MIVIFGHRLTWLAALILVAATWRICRLIVSDQWPGWYQLRGWLLHRWRPGPARPTELLVCPWCVSMYVAAAVVTFWLLAPTVALAVCLVLAVSAVAALITAWTD